MDGSSPNPSIKQHRQQQLIGVSTTVRPANKPQSLPDTADIASVLERTESLLSHADRSDVLENDSLELEANQQKTVPALDRVVSLISVLDLRIKEIMKASLVLMKATPGLTEKLTNTEILRLEEQQAACEACRF